MIRKEDFEKMNNSSKIERISSILNEFESGQLSELREFRDIRKDYLSEDILINIYNILRSQHRDFINNSASLMSEYMSNIRKQEQEKEKENISNPDDILNSI